MVWFYRCSNSRRRTVLYQNFLSIPLWSDFIEGGNMDVYDIIRTFNPTMVWFYQPRKTKTSMARKRLSIPLWSDFIQIELSDLYFEDSYFQSHYGLILSREEVQRPIHVREPFNPTMVWFYHWAANIGREDYKTFNPTMVWFYQIVIVYQKVEYPYNSFNPTMVWFYLPVPTPKFHSLVEAFNPTMVWFYPKERQ